MLNRKSWGRLLCTIAVLVIACVSLSSCLVLDSGSPFSGYLTEEEVRELLEREYGELGDNVTVEGGPTYNITVEGTAGLDVAAAGKALLSSVKVTALNSKEGKISNGSGVIYTLDKEHGDAYIITNYHVVYNGSTATANGISETISVYLYGREVADTVGISYGYAIPAQYVGGSAKYDIAVLKIDGSRELAESNATAISLADSDEVAVLDTAIAIGNANSDGISATLGYVNVESEYITINVDNKDNVALRVMRIDTPVNSGNSGGGLFNSKGELIGIVNAKSASNLVENVGYAIPSNLVKYAVDNIIYYCDAEDSGERESVYRCMLGINLVASEHFAEYDTEVGRVHKWERVTVSSIEKGSIVSGKLRVGDVINSVKINDGEAYVIDRTYQPGEVMLNARVGDTVTLNVTRDGQTVEVSVTLTEDSVTAW